MFHSLILLCVGCVASLVLVACGGGNRPEGHEQATQFKLTTTEIAGIIQRADTAELAQYRRAIIEVTGNVLNTERPAEGEQVVRLTANGTMPVAELRLYDEAAATNLQPGQTISVKCKCTGMDILAQFQECAILTGAEGDGSHGIGVPILPRTR